MTNTGSAVNSQFELVVGIDGGGTKTEAVIGAIGYDGTIRALGRGTAGPANLQSRTAADAWQQCMAAIECAIKGCSPDDQHQVRIHWETYPFSTGLFAMAGAGSQTHADAFMQQVVASCRVANPTVTHDARPLVGGGTQADCGIALIAGTGSFSYCRTADAAEDRCGGWGYMYGDEGSGYSLGIAGLRAAVMAHDGRSKPTELVHGFRNWLGENDIPRWLTELRTWDRDQIAGAAKIVCQCASSGDETAIRLIDQAADSLAQHLTTLWNRQFNGQTADIVLAGGLLVGNEFLRVKVIDSFLAAGCKTGAVTVVERSSDAMIRMLERMCLRKQV